jgi:hypothetical protein
VVAAARAMFGSSARVLTRAEAIDTGLYGPVAVVNRERIGDVVIVCLDRVVALATAVEPPMISRMVAYHGSVTAAEMTVPLLISVGGSG